MSEKISPDAAVLTAMHEILDGAKENTPTLPEPIFVMEFLPLFASKGEVDISKWLDIAGNAHNPVRVFNQAGEVLFTVPPLLRTVRFRETRNGYDAVNEVIMNAENKAKLSPQFATAYLEQAMQDRILSEPAEYESLLAWNDIFKRYDYPVIELPEDVAEVIAKLAGKPVDASVKKEVEVDKSEVFGDDFEEL